MKGNEMKGKEKKAKAAKDPIQNPQYICRYKIQPIVPKTFSNKESIAHKESLHNLLEKAYALYSIGGFINHFWTLPTNLPHKNQQNVGIQTIHGSYGS